MSLEVHEEHIFVNYVKELWGTLQKRCTQTNCDWEVYHLFDKGKMLVQGDKSVVEYANALKGIWQQIDHYCPAKNPLLRSRFTQSKNDNMPIL